MCDNQHGKNGVWQDFSWFISVLHRSVYLVLFFAAQEAELNQEFSAAGYKTDRLHSDFFPRPYTGFPLYTRDELHTVQWWERVKSRVETLKPLSA